MNDIHSCSYYCDRPECIKAQRDELRARVAELQGNIARTYDEAISAFGQIYGLINEGEYDKAQDFCRGAAEWWTQDIAAIDAAREGK